MPEPIGGSVAIVHDYLTQRGGAERVVLSLCRAFPDAPIYASLYDPDTTFDEFRTRDVRPLWLDRIRPLRRRHRLALPLLPLAFTTSRVEADVVVCSSSGWAHGIRTSGRKVVYCHSPAKWLYRTDDYLGANPSASARVGLRALAPVPARFRPARSRKRRHLHRQLDLHRGADPRGLRNRGGGLCPPPGLGPDGPSEPVPGSSRASCSRSLGCSPTRMSRAISRRLPPLCPSSTLVVVGDGPEHDSLAADAPPATCGSSARCGDARCGGSTRAAWGLVAASREDFGLTPVEAAASPGRQPPSSSAVFSIPSLPA